MLIIIEGADKAGKTTLGQEIASKLRYEYRHFGKPGANPAREYAEALLGVNTPQVWDRGFLGELVYGPLLRGRNTIDPFRLLILERLARLKGAILIHANPALEVVRQRYDDEGDPLITSRENIIAYNKFHEICNATSLQKFEYRGTDWGTLADFVDQLRLHAAQSRRDAERAKVCSGIGTISRKRTIFVGEELNHNVTWLSKPFDCGHSSLYLANAMLFAGVPESQVYVTNAKSLTTEEIVFHQNVSKHYQPTWIALGQRANQTLDEHGIPHKWIPHPAYWRRFQSTRPDAYVDMIKEAIK